MSDDQKTFSNPWLYRGLKTLLNASIANMTQKIEKVKTEKRETIRSLDGELDELEKQLDQMREDFNFINKHGYES